MAWSDLWTALALVLVIEGILPFLSPKGFKESLRQIESIPDASLRTVGLVSMLAGLALLFLVR
ncbi:MAG TPA: DUF2065 domain-containing protein [Gammaproteobacteria bacterium]|nr:DUF2065 domain-containing protein [Gammaproteobacteria bacterium]